MQKSSKEACIDVSGLGLSDSKSDQFAEQSIFHTRVEVSKRTGKGVRYGCPQPTESILALRQASRAQVACQVASL